MGLDITAYGYLKLAPDAEVEDGYPKDDERHWLPGALDWPEKNWPGRAEGIEPNTVYTFFDRYRFRAGSYSGYGQWRDWLATVAGFKSAQDCWDHGKAGEPFYELIHFADNEGVIGPVVAKKLADDFRHTIGKAAAMSPEPWFIDQYVRWYAAFLVASSGGAVDFH